MGIEQMPMNGQFGDNRRPDQPLRILENKIPGDLQIASTFAQITTDNPKSTEEKRIDLTMEKLGIARNKRDKVRSAIKMNSRIAFGNQWRMKSAPKRKDDESE
jgi:hypothetical protein